MAKQVGNIKFVGRLGNLCFYMVKGRYYVRTISSLTRKRVKTDKKFARTMEEAGLLGRASRIASFVYNSLPASFRRHWMFNKLTGEASRCLRKGISVEETTMLVLKTSAEVCMNKKTYSMPSVTTGAQCVTTEKKKKVTPVLR